MEDELDEIHTSPVSEAPTQTQSRPGVGPSIVPPIRGKMKAERRRISLV